MKHKYLFLLPFLFPLFSRAGDTTYAERLGYPKGAKVLILHVDDAGMSYESNAGAINALTKGAATSVSVMMPCPWVPGFVRWLKQHPGKRRDFSDYDISTLTMTPTDTTVRSLGPLINDGVAHRWGEYVSPEGKYPFYSRGTSPKDCHVYWVRFDTLLKKLTPR
ncbi:ChbG/HpnK family deacetylase [Puia sp. P3]|uniref:ChbG/HpnK family deacetylase n=1 Tax=Puia sp. P3 TaxID=3423952 RepID=UPI003D679143